MQIVVDRATKRFGSRTVFADYSTTFDGRRITALVGPSGSGKTTLMSVMAGLLSLDEGTVSFVIGGEEYRPSERLVAWVPQGNNALSARGVLDNVRIGPLASGVGYTDATGLALTALRSVRLEHRLGARASVLSGGELQRMCFARAIASRRPCIFADEPSSNLDEAATRRLAEVLRSLSASSTIIVGTHDPIMIDAADAVVALRTHGDSQSV